MKILLLGSQGNLGTALSSVVDPDEHSLIAWDKDDVDVTDEGLLRKKIVDISPELIINAVAYNDVDACETKEEAKNLAQQLNVELVRNLALAAMEVNAILVHYSSDYVFKGDEINGYDETAETNPQSVYAQSKLDGEKELVSLSGKGLRWYLIRTSKLFGPKGLSAVAKPGFFELMLNRAESNAPLKVVNDEIGSFTYTKDLAMATLELVEANNAFGMYHIVNDGQASWYDAARYFFEKLGRQVQIEAVPGSAFPRPAKRPQHSLLLNTKIPALRSWQSALDDYIAHLSTI